MTEQTESGLLHSGDLAEPGHAPVGRAVDADHDDTDSGGRLGASRGLVLGVLLGLAFWAIIGIMIWL